MNFSQSSRFVLILCCIVFVIIATSVTAEDAELGPVKHLIISVGNRLHANFHEMHSAEMHERIFVGDSDYTFEVVEFYPHFARIDSTKEIVSLSDEPTNVAFKFVVFENDSIVDTSYSFFSLQVPHFSRSSYLYFNVLEFEYRGEVFKQASEDQQQ